ncbi:MAG: hypothetical protein Q9217_003135 [Psora testacea]
MARDHPHPRVREPNEQHEGTTVPSAEAKLPGQRPPQLGDNPPALSSLAIDLQKQLGAVDVVKWRLDYQTRTGQAFRVCDDEPDLKEIKKKDAFETIVCAKRSNSSRTSDSSTDAPSPHNPEHGNRRNLGSLRAGRHVPKTIQKKKRSHASTKAHKAKRQRSSIEDKQATGAQDDKNAMSSGSEEDVDDEPDDDFEGMTRRATMIRVDEINKHYVTLFKMIQQMGCKKILQAWLKKCHPRKQASNPYNGGSRARSYADYEHLNRGKHTVPVYWLHQEDWRDPESTGCRHREPDHIKKWERLNLLVHLLRLGRRYEDFSFDVDALEESTKDIAKRHKEHFHEGATDILADIYRARRKEIQYEQGEIGMLGLSMPLCNLTKFCLDGNTMISIIIPHQPKGQGPRTAPNATKTRENSMVSLQCSDSTDVDSFQSNSSSFVTPVANMTLKSVVHPMRNNDQGEGGCALPPSPKAPHLAKNEPVTDQEHITSGVFSNIAPLQDIDLQYQADADSSSGHTSRSLSQASHTQSLLPLIPVQGALSASTSQEVDTPMTQTNACFHKETIPSHSKHCLSAECNHVGMYKHSHNGQGKESHCINPAETYLPCHSQAQMEVRLARSHPSYSSSGLEGVLPYNIPTGNGYPYLAPSQPPPSHPVRQRPVTNPVPAPTDYPSYEASELTGTASLDRDWLLDENWYPTCYDVRPTASMIAQPSYDANSNNYSSIPPQQTTSTTLMPVNQNGQMLAAQQQWQAISAGNGYTQGFVQGQRRH